MARSLLADLSQRYLGWLSGHGVVLCAGRRGQRPLDEGICKELPRPRASLGMVDGQPCTRGESALVQK